MLTDAELRTKLGLEADADVNAALAGILAERNTDPAVAPTEPAEPVTPAEPVAPVQPAEPATPAEPAQEPELVTLSAATYAELTEFAEERRQARRDNALDTAIRQGRIAPAERSAFAAQLERDEEGTITLLGNLAPRFAVSELGDGSAPEAQLTAGDEAAWAEFEQSTFGLDRTPQQ